MRGDSNTVRGMQRQAVNMPIQSLASDINLMAFSKISDTLDPDVAHPISIVHDSVLLEVREDAVTDVVASVRAIMETTPELWHGLPLVADIKTGRTLADEDMTKVTR
jgi:DNA polymerase I-like protein with 3'-5' exonuclease and polymerase domains